MKIGIVGATGAVGQEIINVLEKRNLCVSNLVLFASKRSAGKPVDTKTFGTLKIQEYDYEKAKELDVVFFAVSGSFAKEHAPKLAQSGPYVIDNSSAFRYDDKVPLIIPEINPKALGDSKLIANPNCTTAVAAVALWPLHKEYGIKRAIFSTYQAASGAGAEGMTELKDGTAELLQGRQPKNAIFQYPLPFNVIPQVDKFLENGYTREEMKVVWETQKIFNEPGILISCTAVRIPTLRAHAEAISLEMEKLVDPSSVKKILSSTAGVKLVDEPNQQLYPMPLTATEKYDVEVGRIRKSLVFENGLDLFVCGDQLLRGAALNAVLILELILSVKWQNKKPKMNGA